MTTVIESLPPQYRKVVEEILGEREPELLNSLRIREKPTRQQQYTVMRTLARAFDDHLGPGHEPTSEGVVIDKALRTFLEQSPADDLESE